MDDDLLTPEDLARKFGVSRRRIMEWQNIHQWPHVKVGRTFRWTPQQFKQIAAMHTVTPEAARPNDGRTKRSQRARKLR